MSIPRLLCAFLLLASITGPAVAKPRTASATPPAAAAAAPAVAVPCCLPDFDYDQDGVQDRLDHCNNTPKGCTIDQYGCSIDTDGDGVCDGLDECANTPRGEKVNGVGCAKSQLAAAPAPAARPAPPAPVAAPVTPPPPPPAPAPSRVEQQLVATGSIVLRDVYFETNKATLLPQSEAALNEAGEALAKYPALKIEVGGHTDSRGAAAYNQNLSRARAESVREYLLSHFHLAAGNVTANGYGETQLAVSPEQSADDFAKNRRVVLRALNPDVLPRNVKLEQDNQ